ncbi:MAG TPA: prepilin-type N-terminal cleavage/methylation domain-containing protein [Candidatus Limnocylindrales bacterium]|nr:prepilin-type N-terminal cleavage/methylation domain-containing protein [Candidatus Limnocylindrales bacterium]
MSFLVRGLWLITCHSKYPIHRLWLLREGKKTTAKEPWTPEGGFTLLEIIIALTILSIGLISAIEVFSHDLRLVLSSKEYTQALTHAQELIEELDLNPLTEGTEAGEFSDGYRWQRTVTPYSLDKEESSSPVRMFEVKVTVSWSSGNKTRDVELTTLRTVLTKNETKGEKK